MGEQMSPARTAKRFGHNREFWVSLIKAGQLTARDERPAGGTQARYIIDSDDVERWRESRIVSPTIAGRQEQQKDQTLPRVFRGGGVLARRREARRVRKAALSAQA